MKVEGHSWITTKPSGAKKKKKKYLIIMNERVNYFPPLKFFFPIFSGCWVPSLLSHLCVLIHVSDF